MTEPTYQVLLASPPAPEDDGEGLGAAIGVLLAAGVLFYVVRRLNRRADEGAVASGHAAPFSAGDHVVRRGAIDPGRHQQIARIPLAEGVDGIVAHGPGGSDLVELRGDRARFAEPRDVAEWARAAGYAVPEEVRP